MLQGNRTALTIADAMRVLIGILLLAVVSGFQETSSQDIQTSPPPFTGPARIVFDRSMIFPKMMLDAPTPTNISVINANETGHELQLTKDDRSEDPVWSPDGKKIAYIHFDERISPNKRPLWVSAVGLMAADGKNQEQLTSFQFRSEPTLSWSPDGKTLAVSAVTLEDVGDSKGFVESAIYLLDTASHKSPRLLIEKGFSPSWSPDGSQIVYTCSTEVRPGEFKGSVCVITTISHSAPRVLADNAWDPTWSPSGEHIAYLSRIGRKHQLVICDPDGSNTIPLTEKKRDVQSFAWSPDGRRIAYTEERPMDDDAIQLGRFPSRDVPRIFVTSLDGKRIGPFGEQYRLWCRDVSWSSDGEFLAAVCASGLRDKTTHRASSATSLFVLDSTNTKSHPRSIGQNGVWHALFSPR